MKKEKFIEKARKIHGDKYDYSLVEYENAQKKVKIICPIHGVFMKDPASHTRTNRNQGCPKCGNLKSAKDKKMTNDEYIQKVKEIHGDKYDYSLVSFENIHEKIKVICPEHGIFEPKACNHLHNKTKCPLCVNNNIKMSTESFIKKARKIHGDKYDYSLVEYVNNKTNVFIKYNDEIYSQSPKSHLKGMNIYLTSIISCTIEEKLLKDFIKIHNNKYKYQKFLYKKNTDKIKIICPNHGEFEQTINSHYFGAGCPKCKNSKGELEIQKILQEKNINYIQQHKFDNCKFKNKLIFDFYLPEYNICIEYDGEQHYKSVAFWGGDKKLKLTQERDKIKTEYCIDNNIQLIRIRYDENIKEKLQLIDLIQ